ncbi:Non-specific lipid transfer protein GPI-anchored 7-like protein [Drosera capensis]
MSANDKSMPISVSLFATAWLLLAAAVAAQSGSDVATCGQSLVPCESYINATKPPSSCCDPLKEALDTEKTCLCNILNDPSLLSSFGINVTEALTLPVRCEIAASATNICASVPAASPTNTSPPPPPPPGSAAGRITGSTVFGLIMLWMAFLMLH